MDANEFIDLLNNPAKVEAKSVEELKKLASDFPYSQPVQLLYAIRLSQSSEYLFNRQLGKTSLLTDDRSVLFDLFEREPDVPVEGEVFQQPEPVVLPTPPPSIPEPIKTEVTAEHESFPEDKIEEKEVQHEEVKQEAWPEAKAEEKTIPAPAPAKKLDLSGLSPSEKVKAILEENRRLREEFAGNKGKTEVEPVVEKPIEKEEPVVVPEPVEEEQSEVFEPVVEDVEEVPETISQVEAAVEPDPLLVPEESVFTIEEEKEEPVFSIEDEGESFEVSHEEEEIEPSATEALVEETRGDDGKSHSFSEWLSRLKKKDTEEEDIKEEQPSKSQLEEKLNLVDSFVEKLPELKKKSRLQKPLETKSSVNMNKLMEDSEEGSMVTETLAKVYVRQKHYDKAIKAYEIMKLKYPEKSTFFADQISEIKKLINSK